MELNHSSLEKKPWSQPQVYDPLDIKDTSAIPFNPGSDGTTGNSSA
jgi:hypothetical protein